MSASADLVTLPCGSCGETHSHDTRRFDPPLHDCETGNWYAMPRRLGDALRAMSDDEAAEWCGVDVEVVRDLWRRGGRR